MDINGVTLTSKKKTPFPIPNHEQEDYHRSNFKLVIKKEKKKGSSFEAQIIMTSNNQNEQ